MGGLSLTVEILTLLVDIGILWILIEEFNYDKIQDERKEYKRKKAYEKAQDTRNKAKISLAANLVAEQGTPGNPENGNNR